MEVAGTGHMAYKGFDMGVAGTGHMLDRFHFCSWHGHGIDLRP